MNAIVASTVVHASVAQRALGSPALTFRLGVLVGGAAALVVETERPIAWLHHLFRALHGCLAGLQDDAGRVLGKEDGATKNARVVWEN